MSTSGTWKVRKRKPAYEYEYNCKSIRAYFCLSVIPVVSHSLHLQWFNTAKYLVLMYF